MKLAIAVESSISFRIVFRLYLVLILCSHHFRSNFASLAAVGADLE
jgi:hypothetical protein